MDTNETLGAIRAAEIITQRPYDATGRDQRRFNTEYGTKTVKGIAAIIDRETGAPELLAELEELVFQYEALQQLDGHTKSGIAMSTKAARAAINKAKG